MIGGANRSGGNVDVDSYTDIMAYDRCPPAVRAAVREAPHPISAYMAHQQYSQFKPRYGEAQAAELIVDAIDGMSRRFLDASPGWWDREMAELRRRLQRQARPA